MSSKTVYGKIIENFKRKSRIIVDRIDTDNDCEYLGLLALEAALLGNERENPKKILASAPQENCTDFGKSLYREVSLAINGRNEKEIYKLQTIADEALKFNPDAVIAKTVKGYIAIKLGNSSAGIEFFSDILVLYPKAIWVYHHMVSALYWFRKKKDARPFISFIEPGSLRVLYILGNIFSSYLIILYLILYLVIGLITNSLLAPLIFLGVPVSLVVIALIKGERPLVFQFLNTSMQILFLTYIISAVLG